ncbi:MAG: hypothetical protein EOM35_02405 [Negativicutes bacterium]|nr:hypothetical protein [Negativicutes bacterium]
MDRFQQAHEEDCFAAIQTLTKQVEQISLISLDKALAAITRCPTSYKASAERCSYIAERVLKAEEVIAFIIN